MLSQVLEDQINASLLRIWESLGEAFVPAPLLNLPNGSPEWSEDQVTYHVVQWALGLSYRAEGVLGLTIDTCMSRGGVTLYFIRGEEIIQMEIEFPERVKDLEEHRIRLSWDAVSH